MACQMDVGEGSLGSLLCQDMMPPTAVPDVISRAIIELTTVACNLTAIQALPWSVQWVTVSACCPVINGVHCVSAEGRTCRVRLCGALAVAATRSLSGGGVADLAGSTVYGGVGSGNSGASGWGPAEWTFTIGVPLLIALCIVAAYANCRWSPPPPRYSAMARCCRSYVPRCLSRQRSNNTIRYDRRNQRVVGLSTALRDASTLTDFKLDASSLTITAPTHATVLDQSTIVSHLHMMAGQPASTADPGYASFINSLISDAQQTVIVI
uniref:Uncharacterized protein n=1 Tax=Plectus sambesii TaxID=2011161 RepID=A0A914XH21_9BILA